MVLALFLATNGSLVIFLKGRQKTTELNREVQMKWMPVIMLVIGVLIIPLAVCGFFMWGISDKDELMALSAVFVFVGIALTIGASVWIAKRGRRKT